MTSQRKYSDYQVFYWLRYKLSAFDINKLADYDNNDNKFLYSAFTHYDITSL